MSELVERESSRLSSEVTSEERTWAALAHASTILTLLVSFGTAGVGGLLFVFVPFVIYLSYRDKSEYVAYHAAQAFALQVVGTLGFFLLVLASVLVIVVAWVVTAVLIVILIGLLLIPVALLITIVLVLLVVAFPFALGGFSIVATIETSAGKDYRYPYLGQWVAEWLERNTAGAKPAV